MREREGHTRGHVPWMLRREPADDRERTPRAANQSRHRLFFFKQKTAYEMSLRDWSSDVCSSDLYDNIAFGLRVKKVPKDEIDRRVNDAARILGLEAFLKRKPKALSGGQRQRVAMGRAIVRQPQAFLMDEPLSNLDAKLRVQMRAEIAGLQRDLGVTTIYVTHDQVEAMTMGDRVAVMRKGELQQVADPQTLYDQPVNLFVGGFIGSPSMNVIEATLEV